MTRARLTAEKKKLIRMVVAFVVATKHHLRAEGGVHHEDLKGWFFHTYAARHVLRLDLLPPRLAGASIRQLRTSSSSDDDTDTPVRFIDPFVASPMPFVSIGEDDEEASLGVERGQSRPLLSPATSSFSHRSQEAQNRASPSKLRSAFNQFRPARAGLKRRPTAVRIMSPSEEQWRGFSFKKDKPPLHDVNKVPNLGERTPLIKPGVRPDIRRTAEDVERSISAVKQVEIGLGKMVELGLPLIMSVYLLPHLFPGCCSVSYNLPGRKRHNERFRPAALGCSGGATMLCRIGLLFADCFHTP
jgi:putative membrane protein